MAYWYCETPSPASSVATVTIPPTASAPARSAPPTPPVPARYVRASRASDWSTTKDCTESSVRW